MTRNQFGVFPSVAGETCTADACNNPVRSRGWCTTHYHRVRRYGSPDVIRQEHDPAAKLAWLRSVAESEPTGECVDWPWGCHSFGYGQMRLAGKVRKATHLVMEFATIVRPAPPADHILHACDRPVCCAPWHLRWGTESDNKRDMHARGRWSRK